MYVNIIYCKSHSHAPPHTQTHSHILPLSVELLSLKCCALTDSSLSQLSSALTDNKTLLHLDLSCNRISDDGVVSLATALRLNRTLLSLTLTNNKIGDRGASALAEVGGCGL